jgi:hypothetical protein
MSDQEKELARLRGYMSAIMDFTDLALHDGRVSFAYVTNAVQAMADRALFPRLHSQKALPAGGKA